MNFSVMTASFPIDELTFEEIKQLCDESFRVDKVHYDAILNLPVAKNYYEVKGFFVLLYNDDADALVAVASAIDLMGLNTYEWSLLVHPMYRNIGLGTALFEALQKELQIRGAVGQLALMMQQPNGYGTTFLTNRDFGYSFSEATLESKAEPTQWPSQILIRPYEINDTASLVEVFCEAFGDEQQEALDLVDYNSTHEELQMWVAEVAGEVVGTITTRKDGDAQWITALAVHPKVEGRGIGTALIYSVKQLAYNEGHVFVKLDVELDNERALGIYTKTGFLKAAQIDYFAKMK